MTASPRRLRVVVVVAAIAGARWAQAQGLDAEPSVGVIELAASGSGSGAIVLHNTGTTAVTAAGITPAPGCAAAVRAAPLTGFTLGAGATRTIAISCAPSPASMQRCGYQVRSPAGAALLEFEAVCAYAGVPSLGPDLTSIDLGTIPVGATASRPLTLGNTGAAPFDQLFVEITDLAGNFAVAAPCNPDARECDAPIRAVAPGASTRAVVTCSPRAPGPHTAELHLTTSAGSQLAAPIALTCTGIATTTPVLAVSPGALDLGAVEVVNTVAAATVHVANTGGGTLKVLAVALLDGGTGAAADWAVTPRAPCTTGLSPPCALPGGQIADFDLVFDPRAIGARDATLLINYHDTADRSLSVPLHGAGSGPTLDLAAPPPILDFGTLPVGTTGTITLALANHGSRNLTDGAAQLMPTGPPFAVTPGPTLAVTTAAPTPLMVSCTPATSGSFTAALQLSAPDVLAPPALIQLRCAADPATTLIATPPAILLGEVRIATPITSDLGVTSAGLPISLTSAALDTPIAGLTVRGAPATPPATLELSAAPQTEGSLDDRITVTPSSGPALGIAVTGAAVTPMYNVPSAVSLGTICVQQPTTPQILALSATGTATLGLAAPVLRAADSPFDLALITPVGYPNIVAPGGRATITITPKRRDTAGPVSDDVIWTTDFAGAVTSHTTLTATFVADGGAIAPGALAFGRVPIHVDTHNAQQVTLQNCSGAPLQLDAPQVPVPFSIDSPSFPTALNPSELATFSVGFHPTRISEPLNKTLVITSPQLRDPLTIDLSGEGIAPPGGGDDAGPSAGIATTSFYACSCTSNDPSAAIAISLAALGALVPRRRRTQ